MCWGHLPCDVILIRKMIALSDFWMNCSFIRNSRAHHIRIGNLSAAHSGSPIVTFIFNSGIYTNVIRSINITKANMSWAFHFFTRNMTEWSLPNLSASRRKCGLLTPFDPPNPLYEARHRKNDIWSSSRDSWVGHNHFVSTEQWCTTIACSWRESCDMSCWSPCREYPCGEMHRLFIIFSVSMFVVRWFISPPSGKHACIGPRKRLASGVVQIHKWHLIAFTF